VPQRSEPRSAGSRRLFIASLLLGAFVLFDLGLLGWFIFRSLSEREIRQVLIETREEVEDLAQQIAGGAEESGDDLYTLIAIEREKQTYIDSILKNRDIVRTVEIRDREGRLVFRAQTETLSPPRADASPQISSGEVSPRVEEIVRRQETLGYDMEVPIGELGILHVGISQAELERRVGVLRSELIRQTVVIGAVTLVVLLLAYATIYWLWKRAQRLEAQADEAERMAYIGTLASGLAHEIRNPLNSLNLNIQMLEEEAGQLLSSGSSRRLLAITQGEIGRLKRLVTDFLFYAKPRPLELEAMPAAALLERCRELLGGEFADRGVALDVEDRSQGGRVRVDVEQMTQLLVNLAQNALAAAAEGGRRPKVVLSCARRGRELVLEVADNGVGIPAEDRERIFELFYSTRKGGTGLGLAVVQRIAQAHGADVEVQTVHGSGTRFRLPLAEVAPEPARVTAEVPLAGVSQG